MGIVQSSQTFEMLSQGRTEPIVCFIAARPYGISARLWKGVDLQDGKVRGYRLKGDAADVAREVNLVELSFIYKRLPLTQNAIPSRRIGKYRVRSHILASFISTIIDLHFGDES